MTSQAPGDAIPETAAAQVEFVAAQAGAAA
jgi:hypothetical protein